MKTKHEIKAEPRKDQGKGASRRLRRSGKVPGVLYGANETASNIQLDHHLALQYTKSEWFFSSILDMDLSGSNKKVLLRDIQRHPFKMQIMHIDFQSISENETIRVRVPLHFLNQEISPAGKKSGVLITHELNEVEVSCLAKDLPEYIEIDLANLNIGDIVHLSDLVLPAGVVIPMLKFGKEHDHAVVLAKELKEEVPAPAAAAAAAPVVAGKAAPAAAAKAPAKEEKKK